MLSLRHLRGLRGYRLTQIAAASCTRLSRIETPHKRHWNPVKAARTMHTVKDQITLTAEEQELFSLLLEAAKHAGTGTTLRCAGGWVRDKLLGLESKDIDVALDNMLGRDFAGKVNEYLESQGRATHKAAVIHSNPEQSKHLETARMRVGEIWIDLVNLRSESYAQDSRIPTMEFGTPLQDAERRDFTVNALFYNLNDGAVEDLTGRGLGDLRAGVLRTPLPASETFLDDPLRVLRAVRFATRFGFELDAGILEAAASDAVRNALGSKISRERVGVELEGMFNGPAPALAVILLERLRLFPAVFTPPPQCAAALGSGYGGACAAAAAAAGALLERAAAAGALPALLAADERRLYLLAGCLMPLRAARIPNASSGGKGGKGGAPAPVSAYIIRESLKWRVKEVDGTAALHEAAPELAALRERLAGRSGGDGAGSSGNGQQQQQGEGADADTRVALGHIIRKLKQHWQLGVLLAPLVHHPACATPLGVEPLGSSGGSGTGSGGDADGAAAAARAADAAAGRDGELGAAREWADQQLEPVRELLAAAAAFGLEDCWQWKPLLDGKEAMAVLGMQKAGPQLGRVLAAALDWQLANPSGGKDACVAHLKERAAELLGGANEGAAGGGGR